MQLNPFFHNGAVSIHMSYDEIKRRLEIYHGLFKKYDKPLDTSTENPFFGKVTSRYWVYKIEENKIELLRKTYRREKIECLIKIEVISCADNTILKFKIGPYVTLGTKISYLLIFIAALFVREIGFLLAIACVIFLFVGLVVWRIEKDNFFIWLKNMFGPYTILDDTKLKGVI